jgi:hypothetical protein
LLPLLLYGAACRGLMGVEILLPNQPGAG